jgi:hypothetical protein
MLIIRTIGFGLGLGAVLMDTLYVRAIERMLNHSAVFAYSVGFKAIAEPLVVLAGMNSFFITAFTLSCLAVGLFLASIIYPPFEEVLTRLLSRIKRSRPGSENRLMEAQR